MPDEWFVRVHDKEYGPVDFETLREWRSDGRVIPENDVRQGQDAWQRAADVPELFGSPPPLPSDADVLARRRTFNEVIAESFRIYLRGFPQFFALALLVAIPSLGCKLAFAYVHYPPDGTLSATSRIAAAIAIVMLAVVVAVWPIFVGGLQFVSEAAALGRPVRLRDILQRATNFWPRLARLSLFVYGSYIFWTALPLLVVLSMVGNPSFTAIFLSLLALVIQVYMAGRLFINFLFWQQTATLGGLESAEALQASKDLARTRRARPMSERPLFRGAVIASIWLLLLLAVSAMVELPFMMVRLRGVTEFEDAYLILQNVLNAPAPDVVTIVSNILSSLVHAALRPLLGIAFVVLYWEATAGE